MFITFCIFAYNEEMYLPNLLKCLRRQDYPHENIEVLLIDSMSKDSTKAMMEKFALLNNEDVADMGFRNVKVCSNPGVTQPCAWNVALDNYSGEALLRVDAHSEIPSDFTRKNVEKLEAGEYVCGGPRPVITKSRGGMSRTVLMAETSKFGAGIAPYRNKHNSSKPKYVTSLFHAAFRREVFDKVGRYNEKLIRTEDNDMNYRIRKAGFKLAYYDDIISYQVIRPNLFGSIKQKYDNGYWIGKTLFVNPKCIRPFHLAPLAFLTTVVSAFMMYRMTKSEYARKLLMLVCKSYVGMAIVMSLSAMIKNRRDFNITTLLLPFIFGAMHVAYGLGSAVGIIKGFLERK